MNSRTVFSYLGLLLEVLGILMIVPIIISGIFSEGIFLPFASGALISFVFGFLLSRKYRRGPLDLGSAMLLSVLALLMASLLGSIPYAFHLSAADALFESVSGFTTTGLTTVNPETLPQSILLWRSLTQWIGGAGILLIALLLLSSPGMSSYYSYNDENTRKIGPGNYTSVKRFIFIYSIYTVLGIFLLFAAGMPFFDSILHSFTAISTGGFSSKAASIGAYASMPIELVIIILMILGSTSFFLHEYLFRGKISKYLKNAETQLFWILAFASSVLISLTLIYQNDWLRQGIFHAFSALTTSGFTIAGEGFPGITKFLIILLMCVGGFAGSTAGGLKIVRMGILGKSVTWLAKRVSSPLSAVIPLRFNGKVIKEQELAIISMFSFIYILLLILSTIGMSFLGYSPMDSFFISASAEGNVGLSTVNVAGMGLAGKSILAFDMLVGRLEILPFLFLLYAFYRRLPGKMRQALGKQF